MSKVAIVRCVDNLGRLVIPVELRRAMGISVNDPVKMTVDGERIIVEKHQDSCLICGKYDNIIILKNGKKICASCIKELSQAGLQD